jgi:hypothetical protein
MIKVIVLYDNNHTENLRKIISSFLRPNKMNQQIKKAI